MEVRAIAKSVRISPKKAQPLAKVLRGKSTKAALEHLRFDVTKSGRLIYKLIFSAVSNAKNNYNLKEDNLRIKALTVNSGPSFKRYWFRSRGSADRLIKRTSHMAVVVEEITPTLVKKPVTAKPAAPKPTDDTTAKTSNRNRPQTPGVRDSKVISQGGAKKIMTTRTTNK